MADVLAVPNDVEQRGAVQAQLDQEDGRRIEAILDAAGRYREPTAAILRRLFPSVGHHLGGSRSSGYEQQARRALNVSDQSVLRTYLERTLPEGVISGVLVGEAVSILGERDQLEALFEAGLNATERYEASDALHAAKQAGETGDMSYGELVQWLAQWKESWQAS